MRATKIVATLGPSPDSRDVIRRLAEAGVDVFRVERLPRDSRRARRGFDPVVATRAYLNTVSPEKKARSDAYFETGTGLSCGTSFMRWRSRSCCFKLAVGWVLGGLAVAVLFAAVRKLPRTWHIWGALLTIIFLAIAILVSPVFIAPLFNKYTVLTDASIRDPILRLARSNGIPARWGDVAVIPLAATDPRRVFVSLHSRAQHLHPDVRI